MKSKSSLNDDDFCRSEVERMLKNSQTKVIAPVITWCLVGEFLSSRKTVFSDSEIARLYTKAVGSLKVFLRHDVHIGAKYYDAYGSRMSRYGVLRPVGHLKYELESPYRQCAKPLKEWIPGRIKQHIQERLGVVPSLADAQTRLELATGRDSFLHLVREQIGRTPANFEIFTFAIIKVHLEKFACRIYRDTRTAAHDKGVDLSTNFGVVYQLKKLRILNRADADRVYAELKLNFDSERLQDGNVILVIDDISKEVKDYLINMKVQSISRDDLLKLASGFDDVEDRQKVLRIVYDEFRREYSSSMT
jgi:hypothetical protein